MDDWPTTVAEFDRLLGAHRTDLPTGLTGRNFLTDELLGTVLNSNGEPVEISTGIVLDHRLFGVTYPRRANGVDERDGSYPSLEAVAAALGYN